MDFHNKNRNFQFEKLYKTIAFREIVDMFHISKYYKSGKTNLPSREIWKMWDEDRNQLLEKFPELSSDDQSFLVEGWLNFSADFRDAIYEQMQNFMWCEFPEDTFYEIDKHGKISAFHGPIFSELIIPNKVQGILVKVIGANVFKRKRIVEVKLPVYLECIEERAFAYNKIERIYFSSSLKRIKSLAFAYNRLMEIPSLEGVEIAKDAFKNNHLPSIEEMIEESLISSIFSNIKAKVIENIQVIN